LLGLIGYRFGLRQKKKWGISLYWFTVACSIHALIDIVTHHSDGPLLFFPLNWSVRFRAPVSYWDIQHSGKVMALFEQLLNSAILIYLAITRLVNNTLNKWMAQ
jgi:hypothetical protein